MTRGHHAPLTKKRWIGDKKNAKRPPNDGKMMEMIKKSSGWYK